MTAASLLSGPRDAFVRASSEDLQRAKAAVARLKAQPPSLQSLRAWDEATSAISNASARASLLRSVHPDSAMRDAGERCEQEAEALSTELALDPEVYAPLSRVDAAGEDKDAQTRARARALNEELVRIGQEFQRNIRDDVRSIQVSAAELEGLPA